MDVTEVKPGRTRLVEAVSSLPGANDRVQRLAYFT